MYKINLYTAKFNQREQFPKTNLLGLQHKEQFKHFKTKVSSVEYFLINYRQEIHIGVLVLFYVTFMTGNLDGLTVACSPVSDAGEGAASCLDAQKLAIQDLQAKIERKSWITKVVQDWLPFHDYGCT